MKLGTAMDSNEIRRQWNQGVKFDAEGNEVLTEEEQEARDAEIEAEKKKAEFEAKKKAQQEIEASNAQAEEHDKINQQVVGEGGEGGPEPAELEDDTTQASTESEDELPGPTDPLQPQNDAPGPDDDEPDNP